MIPNVPVDTAAAPNEIREMATDICTIADGTARHRGFDPLTIIALISLIVNILWYCKPDKISRALQRIEDRPYGPFALTYRLLFWTRMPKGSDCRLLWPAAIAVGLERTRDAEAFTSLYDKVLGMPR